MVTFNAMDFQFNGRIFSADSALIKLGIPGLGIVSRGNNWFPTEAMIDLLPSILPVVEKFSKRIGYGYSMGAHGAIKHSRLLGLTSAIAFSPQWSIDPASVPWEWRYTPRFSDLNKGMEIAKDDCSGTVILIFDDKFTPDLKHVEHIEAAHPCHRIPMRYCGHETLQVIASTDTVGAMFQAAVDGDLNRLSAIIKQKKKSSSRYRASVLLTRARRLRERGRLESAIATAETAMTFEPGHFETTVFLSQLYLETRRLDQARDASLAAIAIRPKAAWLYPRLIDVYLSKGEITLAREAFEKGSSLNANDRGIQAMKSRLDGIAVITS